MDKKIADKILDKVKDDYNRIATDFSSKRDYLSKDLISLQQYAKEGDRILDLGCGNGRLSELFPNDKFKYLGADVSFGLIKIAKERYPAREFKIVPSISLPFPDGSFDIIYCLAVFHHIPSKIYRRKFLREIRRVLKQNGKLVLTTWKLDSKSFQTFETSDEKDDLKVPFKDSGSNIIVERYIHAFSESELNGYLGEAGFKTITLSETSRGKHQNLFALCQK